MCFTQESVGCGRDQHPALRAYMKWPRLSFLQQNAIGAVYTNAVYSESLVTISDGVATSTMEARLTSASMPFHVKRAVPPDL